VTPAYPPSDTWDSVTSARVQAVAAFGFTERQSRFLVTVMVHAGCFLERQYCTFTGTVRGHNSREFIGRLVARGFIRVIEPGPVRRGRLYHVHHKPLYEAIGQADNRNRRLHTLGRMVERVMILDALLEDRRCWWLSPADDKLQFFSQMRDNRLQREDYPHIAFGAGRQRTIRCFPDKLPIGIEKDSTEHLVFLYLVNRRVPVDFRQFLLRHVGLLRMVHRWTLRLVVPRRFRKAVALYKAAIREELWTPLNPSVSRSLEAYFADCHARGTHVGDPDDPYLRREFSRQGSAKIQSLYRAWRARGDRVLWEAPSTVLADDRTHGCARVEVVMLDRQYLQLAPAMDRDAWAKRGAKRKLRQVGPPVPEALPSPLSPLENHADDASANA
jgi:hypothetical protein